MTYRVELSARAIRDLRQLFRDINAADSQQAHAWFNGLEAAILTLDEHPLRCPCVPGDSGLRQLLCGHRRNVYRIIFAIDEAAGTVAGLHIRHGARRPLPK